MVRLGETHPHAILNRSAVILHAFRWACQLRKSQHKEMPPNDVVEEVASNWPFKLPFEIPQLKNLLIPTLSKNHINAEIFRESYGEEKLVKLMVILQTPQSYWTEPSTHVETSALPANNDSSELDNSDELPAELEKTSRRLTSG